MWSKDVSFNPGGLRSTNLIGDPDGYSPGVRKLRGNRTESHSCRQTFLWPQTWTHPLLIQTFAEFLLHQCLLRAQDVPCPALDALGLRDEDGDWAPEEHGRSRDHTAWLLPAQGARSSRVEPTPAQRVKQKQIPGQPPHHTHTYTHTHTYNAFKQSKERSLCRCCA